MRRERLTVEQLCDELQQLLNAVPGDGMDFEPRADWARIRRLCNELLDATTLYQ